MTVEPPPDVRTAYLARYEAFEAEIVLDILNDAGIYAYAKHPLTESEHIVYSPALESERGIIMVDASRIDEAKRLIEEQLPQHLASIGDAMTELESSEADAPPPD